MFNFEDGAFRTRILKALPCNLAPPLYAGHSVHFLSVARESGSPCKNHKNMIVLMIRGFSDSGDSGLWILPVGMSRFQGGSRLHARLRVLKAVASCGDGNPPPRQRVRSKRGFSSEIQDFAVFGRLSSLDPSICSEVR